MTIRAACNDEAVLKRIGANKAADLMSIGQIAGSDATLLSKPGLEGRQRWRIDSAGGRPLYLKRYAQPGWRQQLDRLLKQSARHSRGWWEFEQARVLNEAHIPAARAVAYAEDMAVGIERRSAVLFESAGGEALDRLWERFAAERAPVTRGLARHDLAVRLARFISAFHQTGMCHRDLYLCHVFADLDAGGARPPRFTLIDLARTHRPRWRRMRWLIKDLSQLDASARQVGARRTDRLRFLTAYLGLQPGAPRVRVYARRILRKSDAILRQIARRAQRAEAQRTK